MMGKSSAGKDSLYAEILKYTDLREYTMYTTRPRRDNEVEGREYRFVDKERLEALRAEKKVIEERTYMTVNGPWTYFTVDDGSFDDKGVILMIGTPESFISMKRFFGEDILFPIYIECEDGIRLERALKREKKRANPDYKEMCRRFLADCEDFSEDRLKAAGITEKFSNLVISECRANILEYISSHRSSS